MSRLRIKRRNLAILEASKEAPIKETVEVGGVVTETTKTTVEETTEVEESVVTEDLEPVVEEAVTNKKTVIKRKK